MGSRDWNRLDVTMDRWPAYAEPSPSGTPLDINDKPQDGLVGNLTYRYLDMVAGKGPNIDRLEATLSYRW